MKKIIIVTLFLGFACALFAQENAPTVPDKEGQKPETPRQPPESKISDQEIAAAVKALCGRFDNERREARKKLILAGDRAVKPLLEVLGSESAAQRAAAAEILGFVGGEDVAPDLVRLIRDGDLTVRDEARKALARIGPAAIKYLEEALREGTEAQRKEFELAVSRMVNNIIRNLVAPGNEFGDYPGQFDDLKKIGSPAVPALVRIAKDNSPDREPYRYLAITALGRMGDKSVIPVLKEIFEKESYFRDEAAAAIAGLGDDTCANLIIEEYRMNKIKEPEEYVYPANLALFYHKLEKWKEAEAEYKKAIEVNPENTGAYYNYACLLSVRGRLKEGMAAIKKSVENGYSNGGWIMRDKELDNLRKLPEFKQLIEKRFGKAAGAE